MTDSSAHPSAHPVTIAPEAGVRHAQAAQWLSEQHAVLWVDADWRVVDCSRGATPVLGYAPDELIGCSFDKLVAPTADALPERVRARAGRATGPFVEAGWMLRRDGLAMWAEVSCSVEPGARPWRMCLAVRDATLQLRASQYLRGQADAVATATSTRNLFLGSIAHELRAALAPITTSAVLLERTPVKPELHQRLVAIVQRSAASAARLVEDLLTFSTMEENKLRLRPVEVDLQALLGECIDAVRQQAASAGIGLRLDAGLPPAQSRLRCDPERVRQVVVNLLGNAIKFTPSGGRVCVRAERSSAGVAIEVADTGAGIDPVALPFIFDPFEQGGAEVTERHGGFGLGLSVCAEIARRHGGRITASSPGRGQGATFVLHLPGHGAQADRMPADAAEPQSLHVLYVEDDADAADAMRYALTTLGWTLTHAGTCAQARELVGDAGGSFDVILADLGLPDGSGLELGSEMSDRLPVVALTAYGAPLAMQGFASQLIKPADIGEVRRALVSAVAQRQRSRTA